MSFITDRRIGRFAISVLNINENPEAISDILGTCIVLEATASFVTDTINYTAISPGFDELNNGEVVPEYDVEYDAESSEVSWTRVV